MIDEDNNGFISREELQKIFGGLPIKETQWTKLLD